MKIQQIESCNLGSAHLKNLLDRIGKLGKKMSRIVIGSVDSQKNLIGAKKNWIASGSVRSTLKKINRIGTGSVFRKKLFYVYFEL